MRESRPLAASRGKARSRKPMSLSSTFTAARRDLNSDSDEEHGVELMEVSAGVIRTSGVVPIVSDAEDEEVNPGT